MPEWVQQLVTIGGGSISLGTLVLMVAKAASLAAPKLADARLTHAQARLADAQSREAKARSEELFAHARERADATAQSFMDEMRGRVTRVERELAQSIEREKECHARMAEQAAVMRVLRLDLDQARELLRTGQLTRTTMPPASLPPVAIEGLTVRSEKDER
jgi:hypothetical protein